MLSEDVKKELVQGLTDIFQKNVSMIIMGEYPSVLSEYQKGRSCFMEGSLKTQNVLLKRLEY